MGDHLSRQKHIVDRFLKIIEVMRISRFDCISRQSRSEIWSQIGKLTTLSNFYMFSFSFEWLRARVLKGPFCGSTFLILHTHALSLLFQYSSAEVSMRAYSAYVYESSTKLPSHQMLNFGSAADKSALRLAHWRVDTTVPQSTWKSSNPPSLREV